MKRVILASLYGDKSLAWEDKEQWVQDNLGFTEDEARNVIYALEGFSNYGYPYIHNQDFSGYTGNQYREDARMIDKLLLHPNMPKYHGTLYRGLTWKSYELDKLESILDSGVWQEPGITSFTTDISIAKRFAEGGTLSGEVLITLEGNKHACEVGFLSQVGGEGEVLYPSILAKRGLKIVDWYKEEIEGQRISKKTGKPIIIRTKYFVTVRDW